MIIKTLKTTPILYLSREESKFTRWTPKLEMALHISTRLEAELKVAQLTKIGWSESDFEVTTVLGVVLSEEAVNDGWAPTIKHRNQISRVFVNNQCKVRQYAWGNEPRGSTRVTQSFGSEQSLTITNTITGESYQVNLNTGGL